MTSIHIAQRGTGVLREFNEAGVLSGADVHIALRLGRLGRETAEPVLFAVALTARALRSGSVCLDLSRMRDIGVQAEEQPSVSVDTDRLPWPAFDEVLAGLRASPLVCGSAAGPLLPLRLVDSDSGVGPLLYFDRYHHQEQTLHRILTARRASAPRIDVPVVRRELERLFGPADAGDDRQRLAAAVAATSWTTVVAGGPGTGKTHTIARILALLIAHHSCENPADPLRIALAAPTGKAAARLQEAVASQAADLGTPESSARTVHRLLGWQRSLSATRFRYHAENRLPYDVVVVDESSMVSLSMMSRLVAALRPDSRLILVGDPDQLASVDAGAVLADLVASRSVGGDNPQLAELLDDCTNPTATPTTETATNSSPVASAPTERAGLSVGIVHLTQGRRFGGRIAQLAAAVRAGDSDTAVGLLREGSPTVELVPEEELAEVRADIVAVSEHVTAAALAGDAAAALEAFDEHRVLCAHRRGPYGVEHWDRLAASWSGFDTAHAHAGFSWTPGLPLLVTANDHEARIYNGDTGVVVRGPDGGPRVALHRGNTPMLLSPSRIPAAISVFAMTIHRSQGSQYQRVSIVLPGQESSLLTRELLYTAITRARQQVRIIGSETAIRAAIDRRVLRASGLRAGQ